MYSGGSNPRNTNSQLNDKLHVINLIGKKNSDDNVSIKVHFFF